MRTTERQTREGEPSVDDMRRDLAEQEAMNIPVSQMIELLIEGFEGLDNISKSIINSVDLILNFEVKSSGIPSEVIKINNGKIEYLRK